MIDLASYMHSFGKFLPTPSPDYHLQNVTLLPVAVRFQVSSLCMMESVCIIQSERGIIEKDRPQLETSQSSVYN